MNSTDDRSWRQCLFRSHLAETCRYKTFVSLVQPSRTRNAAHGIGGCLLFDGQRFCQLIEGPAAAVSTLWQRIGRDPRHRDVGVLLDQLTAAPDEPARWSYGYCGADDLDCFDRPTLLQGPAALAAFAAIRARADLVH